MTQVKKKKKTKHGSGYKTGIYIAEKDYDLIEFLENQPETTSKIFTRLLRDYKDSLENPTVSNQELYNEVKEFRDDFNLNIKVIKELLHYRTNSSIDMTAFLSALSSQGQPNTSSGKEVTRPLPNEFLERINDYDDFN